MRNFTSSNSKALLANLTRFLILGLTMDAMLGCSAAPGQGGISKVTSGSTVTDATNSTITSLTERPVLTVNQVQYFFPASSGNAPASFEITNRSRYGAYDLSSALNVGSAYSQISNDCNRSSLLPGEKCHIVISFLNTTTSLQLGSVAVTFSNSDGSIQNSLSMNLKGPGLPGPTPSVTPTPTPTVTAGVGTLTISSDTTFQKSNVACGTATLRDVCNFGTPSTFDGANCHVGAAPFGTASVANGFFYYTPRAGNQPCAAGDSFDGSKCRTTPANGNRPFVHNNHFYFTPNTRVATQFKGAECPVGTTYDSWNCVVGDAPRGPATESHNLYGGKMIYPARPITPTDLTPCEQSRYFDGKGCVFANTPMNWRPFIINQTRLYLEAKNYSCAP
ncbi:MAG: hypothetical protein H7222_01250 [Methylotenera sp.]|nr:hypothetical protein [Oligoflexia bacterium]